MLIFPFFPLSDVHPSAAQRYQHVPGFVTDDIFSSVLVINRKLNRRNILGMSRERGD